MKKQRRQRVQRYSHGEQRLWEDAGGDAASRSGEGGEEVVLEQIGQEGKGR